MKRVTYLTMKSWETLCVTHPFKTWPRIPSSNNARVKLRREIFSTFHSRNKKMENETERVELSLPSCCLSLVIEWPTVRRQDCLWTFREKKMKRKCSSSDWMCHLPVFSVPSFQGRLSLPFEKVTKSVGVTDMRGIPFFDSKWRHENSSHVFGWKIGSFDQTRMSFFSQCIA